jgi:hypothetical protein
LWTPDLSVPDRQPASTHIRTIGQTSRARMISRLQNVSTKLCSSSQGRACGLWTPVGL